MQSMPSPQLLKTLLFSINQLLSRLFEHEELLFTIVCSATLIVLNDGTNPQEQRIAYEIACIQPVVLLPA
jgi:hypothetical protein